jgi:hypothetical protein
MIAGKTIMIHTMHLPLDRTNTMEGAEVAAVFRTTTTSNIHST